MVFHYLFLTYFMHELKFRIYQYWFSQNCFKYYNKIIILNKDLKLKLIILSKFLYICKD